ncbi:MAG TPA: DNA translocase FtsK [Firmicutes bacterium]|nr:DNA translocase FtsK [Bacillota bacterium]
MALASLVFLTKAATRLAFARLVGGLLALMWRSAAFLAQAIAGAAVMVARGVAAFFTPDASLEGGEGAAGPAAAPHPKAAPRPAAAPPAAQPPREDEAYERLEKREEERKPLALAAPAGAEAQSAREPEAGGGAVAVHGTQLALLSGQAMYQLPPLSLLSEPVPANRSKPVRNLAEQGRLLEETLENFGVKAKVVQIDQGPVVTRFELQPAPGVKVSRIVSLADDLALSLAAADVRIEAPIPGKAAVGIEVPNKEVAVVHLREILAAPEFANPKVRLPLALGKDIAGTPIVCDLVDMPHLLIAGATGSGKSVCLNTMVASLLYRLRPDEVKLLMIDPKRVELAVYDGIPHLLAPVVTDPKRAAAALKWVVEEMEKRYELFASNGVRNIDKYNALMLQAAREAAAAGESAGEPEAEASEVRPLPYVIVLIDELADLMMVAAAEVEDSICRLAQMARAAGIHLVIATQRPSVDVITGLIKANIPSRVAFAVSSQVDSRTILDMAGAERLLGKGDMLFCPVGAVKPLRVQGAYMTDREVESLVGFWKRQGRPEYQANLNLSETRIETETGDDELYDDAVKLVVSTGNASISMIQRRFRIGYARAARLIDMMELAGVVGPYQGSKPREELVSAEEEQ